MIDIKKGKPEEKGVWFRPDGEIFDTKHKAIVTCPSCNKALSLESHSVDSHGVVFPSIMCDGEECVFHKYVQLSGWEFGFLARGPNAC